MMKNFYEIIKENVISSKAFVMLKVMIKKISTQITRNLNVILQPLDYLTIPFLNSFFVSLQKN